ncbi:MAG TPA: S-layer homology domain-containing protein, partial [Chthonomonadales bacterium]|nr:S-layer homology domain-containing protein [Chthonomonadales bacterium]
MRNVLPILGAGVSALAMAWSGPVSAQQNKFQDVPDTHWAYQAVTDLQQKGILIGYPDGYFRGKRTLTRYEFAVALKRALDQIPPPGTGPAGPAGPQGEPGPPGMTPEEVQELRRLTDEFKNELAGLGTNVNNIMSRLDQLAKDVADIRERLNRMIQFNGDAFFGFRSDRSRYGFFDYSGAARNASNSHFQNVSSPHDFHLEARANLPGGVKFTGDLVESNYLGYRNTSSSPTTGALGGIAAANYNGSPEETTLYKAQLDIPIGGATSNTVLTVGRYANQVTPLTYWRPDTDAYFDLPWYDDGNFIEDGFRINAKFGSATTSLFAGSYSSLTTSNGEEINKPIIGATSGPITALAAATGNELKPFNLATPLTQGAVYANQSAGLHVGVPLGRLGELGVSLLDFSAGGPLQPGGIGSSTSTASSPFG